MIENTMTEDLRRQRRNLLIVSLLLCFVKYGGITINRISILGVEVYFSNISAIFLALWLIWFYFAFRYYQYFMQEGVAKINKSFIGTMNIKCKRRLEIIVSAKHPNYYKSNQQFDYNVLCMRKPNWYTIFIHGHERLPNSDNNEFRMYIKFWSLWKELLSSILHMTINQSVISDFLLPLILALFTIVYCNINDWPGRIANLL